MNKVSTSLVSRVLILTLAFLPFQAGADLVGTDRAAAQSQREAIAGFIARPEVAAKLEALGVSPREAQARSAALTDAEAALLAQRIDSLPAGADPTTVGIILAVALVVWRLYVNEQTREAATTKPAAKPAAK